MEIQVLSVTIETVPTAKGSYQKAAVAYKDQNGKVTGKNVVSFANKGVWDLISKAQGGERYDITNEKIGDNWNWTAARKLGEGEATKPAPSVGSSTAVSTKSTYETPEERAKKQVFIVRQSSISAAIATLGVGAKAVAPADVLKVAKQYEQYVFADGEPVDPMADFPDDIPE